ncbi:unnamed protein product [Ostreobium quekettii]|uniref:BZIP domain-containing protein n=1 Tax=Ostreobium quekettii TaxID=121088 RepID=A0A8S1IN14_9CHLO|nr:unnamed protein product [Ostreobium quekettii]|eukprot:evm.model.scf_829.1 EVM.evm.TU.scf_829.1   scf_829:2711-5908(-)
MDNTGTTRHWERSSRARDACNPGAAQDRALSGGRGCEADSGARLKPNAEKKRRKRTPHQLHLSKLCQRRYRERLRARTAQADAVMSTLRERCELVEELRNENAVLRARVSFLEGVIQERDCLSGVLQSPMTGDAVSFAPRAFAGASPQEAQFETESTSYALYRDGDEYTRSGQTAPAPIQYSHTNGAAHDSSGLGKAPLSCVPQAPLHGEGIHYQEISQGPWNIPIFGPGSFGGDTTLGRPGMALPAPRGWPNKSACNSFLSPTLVERQASSEQTARQADWSIPPVVQATRSRPTDACDGPSVSLPFPVARASNSRTENSQLRHSRTYPPSRWRHTASTGASHYSHSLGSRSMAPSCPLSQQTGKESGGCTRGDEEGLLREVDVCVNELRVALEAARFSTMRSPTLGESFRVLGEKVRRAVSVSAKIQQLRAPSRSFVASPLAMQAAMGDQELARWKARMSALDLSDGQKRAAADLRSKLQGCLRLLFEDRSRLNNEARAMLQERGASPSAAMIDVKPVWDKVKRNVKQEIRELSDGLHALLLSILNPVQAAHLAVESHPGGVDVMAAVTAVDAPESCIDAHSHTDPKGYKMLHRGSH